MQWSHTTLATPALANSRSICGLLIKRPAIATPSSHLLDFGWVICSMARRSPRQVRARHCLSLVGASDALQRRRGADDAGVIFW